MSASGGRSRTYSSSLMKVVWFCLVAQAHTTPSNWPSMWRWSSLAMLAWPMRLMSGRSRISAMKGKGRIQMMSDNNSVVAIFESHDNAEDAVRKLQKDGFDMKKLSIVGKDYHTEEHVVGYYTTGDRMLYWGKAGAFWGGFWGLLSGSAFFWVPGIGQLLVAGPLVMWIVDALEEADVVDGLGALGAALYSIGVPK